MKKLLSALLALVAVLVAYSFAAVSVPASTDAEFSIGEKLSAPFRNFEFEGVVFLVIGAFAILGMLFAIFSKPRQIGTTGATSTKFMFLNKKTKGLEVGFLINGLLALVVIAVIVFGTIKAWFDEVALGSLGAVYVLQLVMGILFLVLFFGKKDKAVLPFLPAIALFLVQVTAGVLGVFIGGPK